MASKFQSDILKGSDTIQDFSCMACNKTEAQFHCEACSKCYCDNCVKLHNQLFNDHPVFGRGQMEKWPITKSTLDILERCTDHTDEKIKLFCEDHSQLCCHICVALHHRQCSKLIRVTESTKLHSTADVQQLSSNIQEMQKQLKKQKDTADCSLQSLEETYKRMKQELGTLRQKINAALDQLEKATLQKLDDLIASYRISIPKERDGCIRLQKNMQYLNEALKEVCNKSSELLFIAFEKCQQQLKLLKNVKDIHEYAMDFVPNNYIEKYLSKLTGLGIIGQPNKFLSLQGKSEHGVNMSSDGNTCCIIATCDLPSGETLILDYNNNKVKLLDKKYKVVSHSNVSSCSYDMCQISPPCDVIVTVHQINSQTHGIQFISVQKGQLVKGGNMQMPHKCLGIANHKGDLYLTSGIALYHYTLTGTLVKKMFEDRSADNTVFKCAINLRGDTIYVTNQSQHKLLTLAMDGTILSSFADPELQRPRGVHVTPWGQVLVCGGYSHTIIQVDNEGRRKIDTLATGTDGVNFPCSVHYCTNTDSVVVGLANNDNILVFKVK